VLDPFAGSGTTGIAASLTGRKFLGIDKEEEFLKTGVARRKELDDVILRSKYEDKIKDFSVANGSGMEMINDEAGTFCNLPF